VLPALYRLVGAEGKGAEPGKPAGSDMDAEQHPGSDEVEDHRYRAARG